MGSRMDGYDRKSAQYDTMLRHLADFLREAQKGRLMNHGGRGRQQSHGSNLSQDAYG